MMESIRAELVVLNKRAATWILLAVAGLLTLLFGYALPYASYLSKPLSGRLPSDLEKMLPLRAFASVLVGVPFYLGVLSLILGVLVVGSEYGWGTLKTSLIQNPSRPRLLAAKLAALAIDLVLFTALIFAVSVVASLVVAVREQAPATWPAASEILRSLGASWLILALWAGFGVVLAVLTRGTALAIGLGILYALVIEGVVAGLGSSIPGMQQVSEAFLRTNAYSLVAPLTSRTAAGGPGAFSGPLVAPWQALAVIAAYLALFTGVSALLLNRRDVA